MIHTPSLACSVFFLFYTFSRSVPQEGWARTYRLITRLYNSCILSQTILDIHCSSYCLNILENRCEGGSFRRLGVPSRKDLLTDSVPQPPLGRRKGIGNFFLTSIFNWCAERGFFRRAIIIIRSRRGQFPWGYTCCMYCSTVVIINAL